MKKKTLTHTVISLVFSSDRVKFSVYSKLYIFYYKSILQKREGACGDTSIVLVKTNTMKHSKAMILILKIFDFMKRRSVEVVVVFIFRKVGGIRFIKGMQLTI